MRVAAFCLIAFASLASATAAPRPHSPAPASAPANAPPHAWLFGSWTGGLFPVLDGMVAQDCRTQPTVVFSRDGVSHATLLAGGMLSRSIVTVRATPAGADFRFAPEATPTPSFGCPDTDELHVARGCGPNEISFPNCTAFPYPLERCSG